jgi:N-methylhydantoinase A
VVEAGHDPRSFVLYAFGGAGPAYCASYAAEVGVREVVVPLGPVASAFSAYGLASSDVVLASELSDPGPMPFDAARAARNFAVLEDQVGSALDRQGLKYEEIEYVRSLDLRYTAQLAEVSVEVPGGPLDATTMADTLAAFEKRYAELYGEGTGFGAAGIQAITFRVRGTGMLPFSPTLPKLADADGRDPAAAQRSTRKVCLDARVGYVETPVYDYRALRAGHVITGPAVIEVPTTTVVVPPDMSGVVDHLGNLTIDTQRRS